MCTAYVLSQSTVYYGVMTKPGLLKLGTTKSGHSDIALGLENKVKDRFRVRDYGLVIRIG